MKVDTKLVAASKKGDKKAFSKLYTMIYKELDNLLRRSFLL